MQLGPRHACCWHRKSDSDSSATYPKQYPMRPCKFSLFSPGLQKPDLQRVRGRCWWQVWAMLCMIIVLCIVNACSALQVFRGNSCGWSYLTSCASLKNARSAPRTHADVSCERRNGRGGGGLNRVYAFMQSFASIPLVMARELLVPKS